MNFNRRQFLLHSSLVMMSSALPFEAVHAQNVPGLRAGEDFSFAALIEFAKRNAQVAYKAVDENIPDLAAQLGASGYQSIAFKAPVKLDKQQEMRDLAIEPLSRGFIYRTPISLAVLRKGRVEQITFSPDKFDWPKSLENFDKKTLGYSGFKLRAQPSSGNVMEELALFQAASFFRANVIGQTSGVMARGLAIGPAEVKGEEFPNFRAFWFDEVQSDGSVTFYAWLDSASISGAYKFKLWAGALQTNVDVEAHLFARTDVAHLGYAPMTSMFLFAPYDHKGVDDIRPAAHRSEGLQIHTGSGEWLWRPLNNPETLQVSSFLDKGVQGFGLIQRQKKQNYFEDTEQMYHQRPSLWVRTNGAWDEGAVNLIEIPSDHENYENIMAYWRPKKPLKAGESVQISYQQMWGADVVPVAPLARSVGFRAGKGLGTNRKFMVMFAAPEHWHQSTPLGLRAELSVLGTTMPEPQIQLSQDGKMVRVYFTHDIANLNSIEFRLILVADEGIQSETWLYRWTP